MNSVSDLSSGSQSKNHYEVLDGLRGVAALLVVAFHILEPNDHGIRFNQIINHGYLAVDFFFLLSGFVVAYAYDDRWPRMSQWNFYKRRLIRLQPMIVMGSLIGAALFYFQRGSAFPLIATTPSWKLLAVMFFGCTLLPLPTQFDIRGWDEMHPLNGPAWSLFFEYIANILYACWLRKLSTRWLSLLTALSAILLLHMLVTGEGDAIGGWALNGAQLHIGFARLLYPFLAGMLLMRSGKRIHVRHGFYLCSLLLVICFALPRFGSLNHLWMNGLYEAFCIIAVFPIIVAIGAGNLKATVASNRLCRTLGDISYPLYLTHYPLIYLYTAWIGQGVHSLGQRAAWGTLLWFTAVAIGYACLKLYDEPVRAWLSRRFLQSTSPGAAVHIPGTDPAFPVDPARF
ncbi:acyltransferase family protein [Tunturibacter empetritectus]|uniref:Peptidoglycan/LPS O-acetylase OafA/YrhL n=1 Tax=Tunturiibacter lichenicola TaxID=2051959 RepID=A0A852VEP6_9BACT|nr:acyltransferase [Edaphobacter lichenicola]NYF89711.1 peptidoglycan/LPS O-acetylase OafA/YrhL [Edaphobacter lichenicola]